MAAQSLAEALGETLTFRRSTFRPVHAVALALGLSAVTCAILRAEERNLLLRGGRLAPLEGYSGYSRDYDPSARRLDLDGVGEADAAEFEEDARMHRLLATLGQRHADDDDAEMSIPDWILHAGEDGHPSAEEAMAPHLAASLSAPHPQPDVAPYTIVDAVRDARNFKDDYAVVVYDNESDEFMFLYTDNQAKKKSFNKLSHSYKILKNQLRRIFPERFCGPECPEFAVAISSGDYPHLNKKCIWNFPRMNPSCAAHSPVLQFGSAFRSPDVYPTMIAMPMPVAVGLHCFADWTKIHRVCHQFTPRGSGRGVLSYGDESLAWEDLKPQLVWRGSDFNYLGHILHSKFAFYRNMGVPKDIKDVVDPDERRMAGLEAMRNSYDRLLPRWQGVVLTAEAEREAEEKGGEPWADIKFAGAAAKHGDDWYREFAEFGVPALGGRMSREELAAYRYQIDIGGGGGTTWTGTIEKLAMPGLLFHHVTPTKDYIHDRMTPWVHYVPVKADLSDLREKYDWAEAHPAAAKLIARQGTELMKRTGTKEGFGKMYEEDFVEPLRRVLATYRPATIASGEGKTWREALEEAKGLPGIVYRS